MPKGIVKTAKDEARWNECKESVRKAHPKLSEENPRFYKMVMGCFVKRKRRARAKYSSETVRMALARAK